MTIKPPHFAPLPEAIYRGQQADGWIGGSALGRLLHTPAHYQAGLVFKGNDATRFGTFAHCAQLEPVQLHQRYRIEQQPVKVSVDYRKQADGWWASDPDGQTGPYKTKGEATKEHGPWGIMGSGARYRTRDDAKAANASDDDQRASVSESDFARAERMVEIVDAHPLASKLLRGGQAEVSMFWVDPDTGCRCSGQADYWLPEDRILVDYKTHGRAIRPGKQAQRWLMDASYHVALAHYCAGIKAALGYLPDEVYVIAQESVEPHAVAVYRLTTTMLALGQWQRQRAIQIYMQASASNIWEGYPANVVDLDPPAWAKPDGFIDWHIEQLSAAMQQQLAEADVEAEIATINARIKTITVEAVRAANALEFQQAVDIWAEAKALKVTLAGLQA